MIYPDRDAYERDGVVVARSVIDKTEIADVLSQIRKFLLEPSVAARRYGPDSQNPFIVDILLSRRTESLRRLVLESNLSVLAKYIIGTAQIHFFYDQIFYKGPRCLSRTQWHQDLPFWPLEGEMVPSLWLALTDVGPDNSPVKYLLGSHRAGYRFQPRDPGERPGTDGSCPDFDNEAAAHGWTIRTFALAPGDVVVHHPLVVHGAAPNASAGERAAISVRYFSGATIWSPRTNAMFFPGISWSLRQRTRVADRPDLFPRV